MSSNITLGEINIVTHDEKADSVCDEKFVLEKGMLKKSLILSGGVD